MLLPDLPPYFIGGRRNPHYYEQIKVFRKEMRAWHIYNVDRLIDAWEHVHGRKYEGDRYTLIDQWYPLDKQGHVL